MRHMNIGLALASILSIGAFGPKYEEIKNPETGVVQRHRVRYGKPKNSRCSASVYSPRPTIVKNPKIAAHMNAMHDKIHAKRHG